MPQPTRFIPPFDFTSAQIAEFGPALDESFLQVKQSIDQIISNLMMIQRDDGLLANGVVHADALSLGVNAMIVAGDGTPRGAWVAGQFYKQKDVVSNSGQSYLCAAPHYATSSFAADLTAGKWLLLQSTGTLAQAVSTTVVPVGGVNSTNVQAAIAELDAEKAPLSGDQAQAFSVAAGSAATHAARLKQVQDNSTRFMLGSGTGNAITASLVPATFAALSDGVEVFVRSPGANTVTAPTLTLTLGAGNTGPVSICRSTDGSALVAGSIAGDKHVLHLIYSATLAKWQLLNPAA